MSLRIFENHFARDSELGEDHLVCVQALAA